MILSFLPVDEYAENIHVNSKNVLAFQGSNKTNETVLVLKGGVRLTVGEPANVVYAQIRKAKGWRGK
jgi:hypothetical protein